jgi:DNA-binding MarR family transcriptional regulator
MVHQKAHTITSRQGEVLVLLSRSTSCSVGEIASTLGVSSAAATKLINRLERKGYVIRALNEWDRRCSDIRLTQAGTKAVRLFRSPSKKEQE